MSFQHSVANGRSLLGKLETSDVFSKLSQYPLVVEDEDLETLEKFVGMIYDRSSTAKDVDDKRLDMFARKHRLYKAIPSSTEAACEACCLPCGLGLLSTVHQPKYRLLPTGVGQRKDISGRSSGQTSHPLQRVANSCPSVDASRNAVVNANTTALV